MTHLRSMRKVYRYQIRNNWYVVHEHPRGAKWGGDCNKRIMKRTNVHATLAHQCQFAAEAPTDDGGSDLVLKPTRFMNNSIPVLKELHKELLAVVHRYRDVGPDSEEHAETVTVLLDTFPLPEPRL